MLASLVPLALRIYAAPKAYKAPQMVFKVVGPFSDEQMDCPGLMGKLAFENLHIPNVRPSSTLSFSMATSTLPTLRAAVGAGVIQILELDHYQRAKHNRIVDRYYDAARAADRRMERDMRYAAELMPAKHPWAESLSGLRTEFEAVDVPAKPLASLLKPVNEPTYKAHCLDLVEIVRVRLDKLDVPSGQADLTDAMRSALVQLALHIDSHTGSDFVQGVALPPAGE